MSAAPSRGRVLPHNLEAEQCVLGEWPLCALMKPKGEDFGALFPFFFKEEP